MAYEESIGKVRIRRAACPGCYIMCKTKMEFPDGSLPGGSWECGESLMWLGLESYYYGGRPYGRVNRECGMLLDALGLDAFHSGCSGYSREGGKDLVVQFSDLSHGAASAVLDMWYEAYRRGILTEANTGLPWSTFGSREFLIKWAHDFAYRKGFGDILARGAGAAVKYVMEHEEFGPRRGEMEYLYQKVFPKAGVFGGLNRHALMKGYGGAVEPWPPCTLYSAVNIKRGKEVHGIFGDQPKEWITKFYGTDKITGSYWDDDLAKAVILHEYYANEADSTPWCSHNSWIRDMNRGFDFNDVGEYLRYSMQMTAEYLSAVFGEEYTQEKLFARDEMLVNLERANWIRDGYLEGAVDTFFDCIFRETDLTGNIVIPRDEFENALQLYYQFRGWKNGVPTRAKLEALGMKDVADALEARGIPVH